MIFAGDTLEVAGLGLQGRGPRTARLFDGEPTLHELEGRYLAHLLAHHKGNRSACARAAGVGRNTLLRKIRLHGLE